MLSSIFTRALLVKIALSFVRAFIGAFIAGIAGIATVPDFGAGKALAIAAIIAALTAGIRAAQHVLFEAGI